MIGILIKKRRLKMNKEDNVRRVQRWCDAPRVKEHQALPAQQQQEAWSRLCLNPP